MKTSGSERGCPEGAWTIAIPTRIIRLFDLERFSGTASVAQSTFRFGNGVVPVSMLFGHGTNCSEGGLAPPAPLANDSATPRAATRIACLIPPTTVLPYRGNRNLRRGEPVQLRVPHEVHPLRPGDDGRVLAVREAPDRLPRLHVEAVRAALQGREVDDAPEHGRRAGDRAVRLELPLDVAGRRVEGVEALGVRADEDELVPDRGRAVDVAARRLRPADATARRSERVDLAVGRADVHAAVGRRRRRVERAAAAEAILRRRLPDQASRARPERVELVVVRADVEPPSRERERTLHLAAGAVAPQSAARLRVEGEHVAAPVADVDLAVGDEGRCLARPDPPAPADAPLARVEGDDLAVEPGRRRLRVTGLLPLATEIQEGHVDELAG